MPLTSFFQRFRRDSSAAVASTATPSEELRTRARRRLIGAALLVLVGVIGFPLLFDTEPRPLPADLAVVLQHPDGTRDIDLPRQAGGASVVRGDEPAAAAHRLAEDPPPATPAQALPAPPPLALERSGRALAASQADKSTVDQAPAAPTAAVKTAAAKNAAAKPAVDKLPAGKPVRDVAEAARAEALLNGKELSKAPAAGARPASAPDVRYIVQIGAFVDVPKAREARLKVEKLGLKTYTQVVNTDDGRRIRVRVGPFADKAAADKAASKIRQAGLSAAILTL